MKILTTLVMLFVSCAAANAADKPLTSADVAGSKDPSYLGRFTDSKIASYTVVDFDEMNLPLGKLNPAQPEARDLHNNRVMEPAKKMHLEGKRTHIIYVLPTSASPLAAIRNYQNAAASKGGKTLFECKDIECGGGQGLSTGGGGTQSLSMQLWPSEKIADKIGTPPYCVQTQHISEQRYTALEFPAIHAYASVLAYMIKSTDDCKNFDSHTVIMLDTLEVQSMAQTMDTPNADEMGNAINSSGRIALYGIQFDSNKADVKPESKSTLDEIGKLLMANKSLKILVVGHTDNVGGFAANLDLSKKRADAVVAQLVSQYKIAPARLQAFGVSYASPVASNAEEAGRAKNRRVELVAN
jgi:OmpA-OmpF porin, OOP family